MSLGISTSFCQGFIYFFFFEILLLISLFYVYGTVLIHLLNLPRYALCNKAFFGWRHRKFDRLQPRGNKFHKEGPNATIILLYSLPVVWFSLLDDGSFNFAAYIYTKDVIFNKKRSGRRHLGRE